MAGAPSDGDGRRNVPQSWEGMLKFCLENTSEDADSESKSTDEEVRLFVYKCIILDGVITIYNCVHLFVNFLNMPYN